jgi:sphingomyelin phosphodiesterase
LNITVNTRAQSDCEGSAIIPILSAFTGPGTAAFVNVLIDQLGEPWLNTTIPANYTVIGWNTSAEA